MIQTIYVEKDVAGHPRTRDVLRRFPSAARVPIDRYTEVFNRRAQNFRLQKRRPALILARKHDHHVLEALPGYGIGGLRNFYFSHLLNCIYDCRYCFLQGMFRSAHYVLFVNYEDFERAFLEKLQEAPEAETYFFSGYDGDSLALEPVSRFVESFLPFFSHHPRAVLELRSKSVQVRSLLAREPVPNVVAAFSFTPTPVSEVLEHGVPSVGRRLRAMATLAERGWKLGLRFDPLIYHERYEEAYRALFDEIFRRLPLDSIHSVSFGPFRMPEGFYRTVARLYPEEPLFAGPLEERRGLVSYPRDLEDELTGWARRELLQRVAEELIFPCLA